MIKRPQINNTYSTVNEYSARLARMASDVSLGDALARAKGWIADEQWLPGPELKIILQRLVHAVEAHPPTTMTAPERAPVETAVVPEKRPRGRPRKTDIA